MNDTHPPRVHATPRGTYIHIDIDPVTIQPRVHNDDTAPGSTGYITVGIGEHVTLMVDGAGDEAVAAANSIAGAFLVAAERLHLAIQAEKERNGAPLHSMAIPWGVAHCGYDKHRLMASAYRIAQCADCGTELVTFMQAAGGGHRA